MNAPPDTSRWGYTLPIDVRPDIEKSTGTPVCSMDECPSYDGKRCTASGFRPHDICFPAVMEMASELARRVAK